jgi:peroxiredoxin
MKKVLLGVSLLMLLAFAPQSYSIPENPEDISPLLVGEKMPTTSLSDFSGKATNLGEMFSNHKTILIFYRGGWCPFCIKHLAEIQKIEKELVQIGWKVIGISPDSPENLKTTMEKQSISFPLYTDADMQLSKNMGIAFKSKYGKMLVEKSGGKNVEQLLPVPAVFAINQAGVIVFEHINPDFKDRINPSLLLNIAKALNEKQ